MVDSGATCQDYYQNFDLVTGMLRIGHVGFIGSDSFNIITIKSVIRNYLHLHWP